MNRRHFATTCTRESVAEPEVFISWELPDCDLDLSFFKVKLKETNSKQTLRVDGSQSPALLVSRGGTVDAGKSEARAGVHTQVRAQANLQRKPRYNAEKF